MAKSIKYIIGINFIKLYLMKRASVILVLLAVVAMATSCGRKNNCPAYGTTSIDKPAYKGRN
jgi:hypothetical protein